MQYELPIDGYAAEFNDDIEFFVACYQHSDNPLQHFIRTELRWKEDTGIDDEIEAVLDGRLPVEELSEFHQQRRENHETQYDYAP